MRTANHSLTTDTLGVASNLTLWFAPGLIFLDEPTTGLDSYNSLGVMDRLSALAGHGRAVVCTIHQVEPTSVGSFAIVTQEQGDELTRLSLFCFVYS